MALNPIKDRHKSAANITDIVDVAASQDTTLETVSESHPDHVLMGVDTSTGNLYGAYNGNVFGLKKTLTLHYDFATDAGAVGTINMRGGLLPNNAIVNNAWYEVTTTFTSSGDSATIALGIATDDATGIEGATAISAMGDIWDAGIHGTDLDPSTASTFTTKTTAERNVLMTIGTEAVTAGALVLHLEYVVSELDTSS